ncbi:nucleotidyltransferase family protein [Stigmatella sp. ncwal1]|uniref:Nucleotidyltransferase family protein n=1 Tax=Stigmatella ashevillensis TaxID=2995309 RepID=A0ABT5DI88_9BACT|nr:nucleotidyltransferase family protein [Stigmatella ashevillena]MDC0713369.1 nucleotidyltransferase family protein [Stigmatella ashevillena]
MAPSLLDMFRNLTSFEPQRGSLRGAPWEGFVDWAIAQGLAPLAAYNLEYRLGGADAPEWARDRLLSVYQGTVNDNVMRLVYFKRLVSALEGRKMLLLGGVAFADSLYPHGGFRPVLEIHILLRRLDVEGFSGFLAQQEFRPEPEEENLGATRVLSDGRTLIALFSDVLGPERREELKGVFERAHPQKLYGPSIFRPDLEDAVLLLCLEQARQGYQMPWLSFVDLRELVTGASWMEGPYSRPLNGEVLKERARAWRLERALYASLSILARLYPQTAQAVEAALPPLRRATRELLNRLVVEPSSVAGRREALRGTDRLRRLLTGQ